MDFAFHYPITVIAVAAGLPVEDVPTFYEQAALLTNVAVDEADRLRAGEALGMLVQRMIDERRREPRGDLISVLVHAEVAMPDAENRSGCPTTRSSRSCACSCPRARRPPTAR